MKVKKGDIVIIKGSAEEQMYKGQKFEAVSAPYIICGLEVVKIKCHETGKYFAGGYATKYLEVKEE